MAGVMPWGKVVQRVTLSSTVDACCYWRWEWTWSGLYEAPLELAGRYSQQCANKYGAYPGGKKISEKLAPATPMNRARPGRLVVRSFDGDQGGATVVIPEYSSGSLL
jgi:hypothetical protein